MSNSRLISALPAALAMAIGAGSSFASAKHDADDPAARSAARTAVQVVGREFRITLSKRKVKPGRLRVEFVNFGEDDHDLAISRKGSRYTRQLRELRPKEREVRSIRVNRGSYVFWCTIDNHKRLGMRATLRVKSTRSRRRAR